MILKKSLYAALFLLVIFFTPILEVKAAGVAPIRILLVPGHDSEVWGAEYGNTKEADMTLALATNIFNILKKDKRFKVFITRDKNGYTKEFADYFVNHQADITAFKQDAKKKVQEKIADGTFVKKIVVYHNPVSAEVSVDLYGINKWANENNIDTVFHVHFNDISRKTKWAIGPYRGFAIYMPEKQMANSIESVKLAKSIYKQLVKKYNSSNYKPEKGGLISDQNLIALGSSNTLDATVHSVLVEYGYIYEKKFRKTSTRELAYKNMASLTATGIKNYFFKK